MSWRHMWKWSYSSNFLDLSTRWWWVVSFMPWPLYSQGKNPWCPLGRSLGGPQSSSGCYGGRREKSCTVRNWTQAVQPITNCYTDWGEYMTRTKSVVVWHIGKGNSSNWEIFPSKSISWQLKIMYKIWQITRLIPSLFVWNLRYYS
jgi:hypothetical protein